MNQNATSIATRSLSISDSSCVRQLVFDGSHRLSVARAGVVHITIVAARNDRQRATEVVVMTTSAARQVPSYEMVPRLPCSASRWKPIATPVRCRGRGMEGLCTFTAPASDVYLSFDRA